MNILKLHANLDIKSAAREFQSNQKCNVMTAYAGRRMVFSQKWTADGRSMISDLRLLPDLPVRFHRTAAEILDCEF